MKLTKCVNGHFYDEEKFGTCPHCAGTSKLNASSIFGQSSAPKETGFTAPPEENDDVAAPVEWEPAPAEQSDFEATPAASAAVEEPEFVDAPKEAGFEMPTEELEFVDAPKETGFEMPAEELEFVDAPKETGFEMPAEEPEFVDAPKEAGFEMPTEEPEFVDASKGTGFEKPAEEPEFSPAPEAVSVDEEPAFDINSQPSFDTPLDFDNDFVAPPAANATGEETDSEAEEEEEEFELLSKYSSDTPSEEAPAESSIVDEEAPAWEMPQPRVEEIRSEGQETIESATDPELEDKPTEIVEEADAELMNGLLSEDEITGNTSQPASPTANAAEAEPEASAFTPESEIPTFPAEPETPAFTPEPEIPTFPAEPEAPAFTPESELPTFPAEPEAPAFAPESELPTFPAEPEAPASTPEPEMPAFSAEPVNPAFVPEQPSAFDLSADEDDDDDGHTVAFYDDVFAGVSKTAFSASEPTTVAESSASDPFTEAANAAATVAAEATMNAMSAEAAEPVNTMPAADTEATNTVDEPNVFTAPPLPKVQNLPTPCVGWLIALNGAHVGQDFHLRVGKNYVGRDESMDVALIGDKSVSRHKHAIITYEPKHHKYFVQPGESNELIYVNDEVVLLPMELKPYDLLVIGDVELWFMPLCDAEHNWSEIIRKLQEQMQ